MTDRNENIRNNILDSILLLLFLSSVLFLSTHDPVVNTSGTKHGISCENIVSQSNAIINIDAPSISHQKAWTLEIRYPKYIDLVSNSVFENRKTRSQISIQRDAVLKKCAVPVYIAYHLLFSAEEDDMPLMS